MAIRISNGPFETPPLPGNATGSSDAVALTDGRFAIGQTTIYYSFSGPYVTQETRGMTIQVIDGIDPSQSTDVYVNLEVDAAVILSMTALADGALLTKIDYYDTSARSIKVLLRVLDPSHEWRSEFVELTTGFGQSLTRYADMVGLPDGGYVVAYEIWMTRQSRPRIDCPAPSRE